MVSNPVWRQSASAFGQMARQWLVLPTPDSLMSLAIFLDATPWRGPTCEASGAAGDDNDDARFAAAIDSSRRRGWWNACRGDQTRRC
jgi:CBS domain-containing protein